MNIKTARDLKTMVEKTGSYFFTRKAMHFFGDTMANYYVPVKNGTAAIVQVKTPSGIMHNCYALQRRHPVKHGLSDTAYFDIDTFERVLKAK